MTGRAAYTVHRVERSDESIPAEGDRRYAAVDVTLRKVGYRSGDKIAAGLPREVVVHMLQSEAPRVGDCRSIEVT